MEFLKFNFRRDVLLHFSAVLLALFVFYSVIFVVNLLKIQFYVGYEKNIIDITVFSVQVDRILWIFSMILFSGVTVIQKLRNTSKGFKVIFNRDMLVLSLFYGMLMLLAIELASFGCWVYNLFFPSFPFSGEIWHFALTEMQLTNVCYPVLLVLLMVFAYSWVGEFTVKGLLFGGEKKESVDGGGFVSFFESSKVSLIIIVFSVVAALFIGYYNFAIAGAGNPGFSGVDVPDYTRWLSEMLETNPAGALGYALKNDRFLYLVLQYLCFGVFGSSVEGFVTYVMPVVLMFLLMGSTFFLVKVGTRSLFHASVAMLVTVFSFQVTVGIYAGFFANWFALVFVYCFYGILIRGLKGKSRSPFLLILCGVFSVAVLYTHPWTWILLVIVILSAYIVTTLFLVYFRKKDVHDYSWELKVLVVLLVVNLVMFYLKGLINAGSGAAVGGYVSVEKFDISLWNAFSLKYFLDRTFRWYVGGFYAFAPAIILGIVGVFSILDYEDRYNRLLLSWMLIASAMLFVEFPWQARFLYLMPFSIYVASGIIFCAKKLFKFADLKDRKRVATLIFVVFFILSVFVLVNYGVRCIAIKQYGSAGLTFIP
ncbi:MAG: hypothetical protein ACOWW1_00695 [archaeon]